MASKFWICLLGIGCLFVSMLETETASGQGPTRAREVPRVLIIGDSISLGYTPYVASILKGRAEVVHNPGNAQHTGTGVEKIEKWLQPGDWDLIHFNWGLWDLCYRHPESKVAGKRDKERGALTTSLHAYEQNLERLVERLKETDATLIWCETTPVPEGEPGRHAGAAKKYNAIAEKIMKRHDIAINDLHGYALLKINAIQKPNDVHFTTKGRRYLAEKVAMEIQKQLGR